MVKWIVGLLLAGSLGMIYAPDPIKLTNSMITTKEEAVKALTEIQSNEVLPLVLIDSIQHGYILEPIHILQLPEDVIQAITIEGKMIKGTAFHSSTSETQIFFCPKENSDKVCLAPKEFENRQRLQCAKEPIPIVKQEEDVGQCGTGEKNIPHKVFYEICPEEKPKYLRTDVPFYEFCYDKGKQKTSFTIHFIQSPKLIESKLLYREHNISYPFTIEDKFVTPYYEAIKNAIVSESNPSIAAKNPKYQVQKLVPNGDMPLALWKKTLNQFYNVELQHKKLFPLWNGINDKVTEDAIQMYDKQIDYYVKTGVFNIEPTSGDGNTPVSEDDDQIYNMWVKMILAFRKNGINPSAGVVILMNNFIDSKHSKSRQRKIESYCEKDLCLGTLTKLFTDIKGRVRCCPLIEEMKGLFGPLHIYVSTPVLEIPGLISKAN